MMTTETSLFEENLERPVYKTIQIQIAVFFGGPLTAVYMIARNYRQFGKPEMVKKTWIYGLLIAIAYLALVMSIPEKFSNSLGFGFIIGAAYAARAIVQKLQGEQIDQHLSGGGKLYSGWNVFAVVTISVLILLAILILPYLNEIR